MGSAYDKFKDEVEKTGYFLSPDIEFAEMLIENMEVNKERYGYAACPCRLASGNREKDLDLICPCDYRDIDLEEHGFCFCGFYVTKAVLDGKKKIHSIPDRRLKELKKVKERNKTSENLFKGLKYPIWRCKVYGYLCSRNEPPETCPICKVDKDRFEKLF